MFGMSQSRGNEDFAQFPGSCILYRGCTPRFTGNEALLTQSGESRLDFKVPPADGVEIASEFFGAKALVNVVTEAKIHGSIAVVTYRPEGAVCGSLTIAVHADIQGSLRVEDHTRAGLCAKQINIWEAQDLPLVVRLQGGTNLLQAFSLELFRDHLNISAFTNVGPASLECTDQQIASEKTNCKPPQLIRLITLRRALPSCLQ